MKTKDIPGSVFEANPRIPLSDRKQWIFQLSPVREAVTSLKERHIDGFAAARAHQPIGWRTQRNRMSLTPVVGGLKLKPECVRKQEGNGNVFEPSRIWPSAEVPLGERLTNADALPSAQSRTTETQRHKEKRVTCSVDSAALLRGHQKPQTYKPGLRYNRFAHGEGRLTRRTNARRSRAHGGTCPRWRSRPKGSDRAGSPSGLSILRLAISTHVMPITDSPFAWSVCYTGNENRQAYKILLTHGAGSRPIPFYVVTGCEHSSVDDGSGFAYRFGAGRLKEERCLCPAELFELGLLRCY
jgi:hypothetical protein